MVKSMGKFMLTRVFRFYQSFFSGKSFMQWAPGVKIISSAESQKGVNVVQQFPIENQKAAITIDFV